MLIEIIQWQVSMLSIALPTYNRAGFLDVFLSIHSSMLQKHGVCLIISDNASTDNTRDIVEKYSERYPVIKYYRNEQCCIPDKNFEIVLRYSETEYVWLIGDTYQVTEEIVISVLDAVRKDTYDALILNVSGRVSGVTPQVYTDRNKLLSDIGWHMTCLGSMIYSKPLITASNYNRYNDTSFLQTGIMFEYLSSKEIKVKWMPEHSVNGIRVEGVKKTSWEDHRFELWTKRWANFVFSLPAAYDLDAKLKCAMDHGLKAEVLDFRTLARLRKRGQYSMDVYRQYSRYFPFTVSYPDYIMKLIAILPSWVFRLL
ncbi:MAG: glycosyltransferase family 2 protein [Chlorobiaceae bacterium]|nr:glycosyltransferase family 2 protein [Chlorobiaceae bacterium]